MQIAGEGGSMAAYAFKTSDSVQQVVAFYRGKFGSKVSVVESPEGALITSARMKTTLLWLQLGSIKAMAPLPSEFPMPSPRKTNEPQVEGCYRKL
jgi:hypothetical protein